MGGLAGHMSHLYSDPNLKLSEIIKLISGIKTGEVNVNEKADGQNIFVTMTQDRQVRFARNKGDYKNGGITLDALIGRFISNAQRAGRYVEGSLMPTVEIFTDGCKAISQILSSISNEMFLKVFNDPNMPETYINCEIIHPNQPNLVIYDKFHIQFHEFQIMGDVPYETIEGLNLMNKKFNEFLSEVAGQEISIPTVRGETAVFSIDGPRFLPPRYEALSTDDFNIFEQQSDQAVFSLNQLFEALGLNQNNTLGDYFVAKLEDEVLPEFDIPDSVISDISHYLVYGTDAVGTPILSARSAGSGGVETLKPFKLKIKSVTGKELADKFTLGKYSSFQNGLVGICLSPIKEIIHTYSLSIVNTADSVIAADPKLARYAARQSLSDVQGLRRALESEFADKPEQLNRYLTKFDRDLALLGNVEDFAQSMEGVVINYVREDGMPMLYKLTGNFAPANQILGASSKGFEIKRSLLDQAVAEYNSLQVDGRDDLINLKSRRKRRDPTSTKSSFTDSAPGIPGESDDLMERRIRNLIRESISRNYLKFVNRNKRL